MKIADLLARYHTPVFDTPPEPNPGGDPPPEPKPSLLGGDPLPEPEPKGGDPDPDPEPKPTPEPEPEPLTLESYTIPEGVEVDSENLSSFTDLMNNNELSRADLAQGLIDLQLGATQKAMESAQEAAQSLWTNTQEEWQTATKALPEIGGENMDETLASIKKGLESVGATADTFAAMDLTGAGNHPEIVRVLHALTKDLVEGGPVRGSQTQVPRSQADKMFGGQP